MFFDSMGLPSGPVVNSNNLAVFTSDHTPVFWPHAAWGTAAWCEQSQWNALSWSWQGHALAWHQQQGIVGVGASPVSPPILAVAPQVEPHAEQQGPAPAIRSILSALQATTHSDVGKNESKCNELAGLLDNEDAKSHVLAWISEGALVLALSKYGCHLVQKAMDIARAPEQERLVLQLRPHVMDMILSMHANHVLAKLVEVLPPSAVSFVVEQLQGREVETAKHRFGCRIWERLIEHCSELQTRASVDAIVRETATLCKHPYGNFVVQHLIEHGSSERRSAMLILMLPEVHGLATHRTASHVVQRGLEHFGVEGKRAIIEKLLWGEGEYALNKVACTRYGSFIVEQVLNQCQPWARGAVQARLAPCLSELQASQFGERVARAMQMTRDDLEQIVTARAGGA